MYQLIEIRADEVTRFIKLKNIETGIIDECFDDSAVISERNFNFMQMDQQYECKIKLFGKPVAEKTSDSVSCKIMNQEVIIGRKPMVEVQVNNSTYYIARQKVKEYLEFDSFNFCFTRKDLIQVNDVIHADLL